MIIAHWRYWDVTALVAGVLAGLATMAAMAFDRWNEALPIQIVATIIVVVAATTGWHAGVRSIIVAGLAAAALSWVPLGTVFYFCAMLDNCP